MQALLQQRDTEIEATIRQELQAKERILVAEPNSGVGLHEGGGGQALSTKGYSRSFSTTRFCPSCNGLVARFLNPSSCRPSFG